MNTMTPEAATALRKPFPSQSVGKLPKSTCRDCSQSQRKRCDRHQWVTNCPECHGSHTSATLHLDYVGHAAITDRLLTVDPEWSWEPFALGPDGLPAVDRSGNLWIRLTVCGVTRIGVGDGKSAKECIGDAIRNVAMRFGAGLDLWAKENLVEFAEHVQATSQPSDAGDAPEAPPSVSERPPSPASESPLLNTSSRLAKAMYAGLRDAEQAGWFADAKAFMSEVVGREITSSKELTEDDARLVLDNLPQGGTP